MTNADYDAIALTPHTWPIGTKVTLCSVPWDSQYRDVVAWDDAESRAAYFERVKASGAAWTNDSFSYLPQGEPVTVRLPYSVAYKFNYCVVENPRLPVIGDATPPALYYFVTGCTRVSPEACRLTLQLDVITTRQLGVCLGSMFVEAGHMAMSNANIPASRASWTGEDLYTYLKSPEGLDVGSEYANVSQQIVPLTGSANSLGFILVMSTCDLSKNPGTVQSPALNVAQGGSMDSLPTGATVYAIRAADFKPFMAAMRDKSWVAQCIISITSFPAIFDPESTEGWSESKLFADTANPTLYSNFAYEPKQFESANIFEEIAKGLPEHYANLAKLYTYPYSVIELTCFNGNSIMLKPELVKGNKLSLYALVCALSPFARIGIVPYNYGLADITGTGQSTFQYVTLGDQKSRDCTVFNGDYLDSCLWIADFPQFSLVNNGYINYLASTAHTRSYSYQSAGWALGKSNAAARLSYDQSGMQRATELANADLGWQQQQRQNAVSAVFGGAGAIGTALGGNVGAGLVQAAQVGTNYALAQRQLGTSQAQLANTQRTGAAISDQNLQYAHFASQGDYRNQIAGINAAVQDAALTPPSTVGQLGGQGFAWKNGLVCFAVKYKTISGSALRTVGDFFLRYGYSIKRFVTFNGGRLKFSNLKVMSKFSYWKVSAVSITCADADETERDAIRGVLEKGVTVWGNPDDIGRTDLTTNEPLRNISY